MSKASISESIYDDDYPICPYCGYVEIDAWELELTDDESEHDCSNCERIYLITRNVSVTYTSKAIAESKGE